MTFGQEITEKMDKKLKVIYDVKSIPGGLTVDNVHNIMINGGIVVWDSSYGGNPPQIIESNVTAYDVAFLTEEIINEKIENIKD